jgi:hypothetical protein
VQIEVAATDASGIRSVAIRISGKEVAKFLGDGPYRYTWQVPAGTWRWVTITAEARDKAGNTSKASVRVRVRR